MFNTTRLVQTAFTLQPGSRHFCKLPPSYLESAAGLSPRFRTTEAGATESELLKNQTLFFLPAEHRREIHRKPLANPPFRFDLSLAGLKSVDSRPKPACWIAGIRLWRNQYPPISIIIITINFVNTNVVRFCCFLKNIGSRHHRRSAKGCRRRARNRGEIPSSPSANTAR